LLIILILQHYKLNIQLVHVFGIPITNQIQMAC